MELIVWLSSGIILVLLICYFIQLYLPRGKEINYFLSTLLLVSGAGGWLSVWLGFGWLTTGVVSSGLCILSFFMFLFTWTFHFVKVK